MTSHDSRGSEKSLDRAFASVVIRLTGPCDVRHES